MQPVLEVWPSPGFDLWPTHRPESARWLPLSGELTPADVGTAMMRIADYNDTDPDDAARPDDALDSFLHGLLTVDRPIVAGGLRVVDESIGTTFIPGCCAGLEDWRDWHQVIDGGAVDFLGHDPSPTVERFGGEVRLTVDTDQSDSPVIELPVSELSRLLAGVERDLTDFYALVVRWAPEHLPGREAAVTAAIARVLDLEQ
jgi:hypothetical protein